MATKLKEKSFLFLCWRAGDYNEPLRRRQDHNHGKIQHRHRCKSKTRSCVWGCVWGDIYVCIYYDKCDSGTGGRGVVKRSCLEMWFSTRKVASSIPLTSSTSVFLHFLVSRFE